MWIRGGRKCAAVQMKLCILRDFLQKRSCAAEKRSFCARLSSNFLQKRSFEDQKRSISARLSANVFATLTNSCACRVFFNVSKSLRLPRKTHFELQKVVRALGVLTILTSKSLSRAGVVQFLRSSTSKSVPNPRCFNDFDFQIALARRRGAKFWRHLGQPILRTTSLLGPTFANLRSHETMEKRSILRNSYPPKFLMSHICAVKHLCCPTTMLRHLPATL